MNDETETDENETTEPANTDANLPALPARDTGRPQSFVATEEQLVQAAAASAAGLRQADLGRMWGVGQQTVSRRIAADERLQRAWEEGRSHLYEELIAKVVRIARDDKHPKQMLALLSMLNNAFKWHQPEHDAPSQGSVKFTLEMPAPMSKALYDQWLKEQAGSQSAKPAAREEREVQEVGDDDSSA